MASFLDIVFRQWASTDDGALANGKNRERERIQGSNKGDSTIGQTSTWEVNTIPEEHRIKAPVHEKGKPPKLVSYASFGGNGTTASLNAYGNILQISRFLKFGRSGFLTVDLNGTPEPYFVQSRMERLMDMSEESDQGIRLEIQKGCEPCWEPSTAKPCLEFVYDRWPRFTYTASSETKNNLDFSLQYFCNRGTVFQTYTWQCRSNKNPIPKIPQFRFDPRICIRDLDFVDPCNHFNDMRDGYSRDRISSGHSITILNTHRPKLQEKPAQEETPSGSQPTEGQNNLKEESVFSTPGLVVSPFAYGKPQEILPEEDSAYMYRIVLSNEAQDLFYNSGILEITMAYRVESRPSEKSWKDVTVNIKELEHMRKAFSDADIAFQRISFSRHQHHDFVIRRNLEHILSVCSIPVSDASSSDHSSSEWETTIAATTLTCGDMSGHRITSSASFFAFQFLIDIFKYLSEPSRAPKDYFSGHQECNNNCKQEINLCETCDKVTLYLKHLRQRIRLVCQGHIRWVYQEAKEERDGTFSPHYWATGECIPGWESSDYMTPRALTDTPFQVIKVQHFMDTTQLNGPYLYFQFVSKKLGSRLRSWVRTLEDDDERGKYVFARRSKDGSRSFFLADHFWINQALNFALHENLYKDFESEVVSQSSSDFEMLKPYVYEGLFPDELRRTMAHRFITVNSDAKKRMIATARTPLETTFQFHSTDTALLYAMDSGFFDKSTEAKSRDADKRRSRALIEEWTSTLEAQADYEEHQTMDWDKPLRYALVLVMALKKRRMNWQPMKHVLRVAENVLLNATSTAGLFPGLLKSKGQPTIFQEELDRDDYWNTTFEVPYILFRYGDDLFNMSTASDSDQVQPQSQKVPFPQEGGQINDGYGMMTFLRKQIPFSNLNNLIDQKGLVELSDDWLQQEPSFLKFGYAPEAFQINPAKANDETHQEDASVTSRQHGVTDEESADASPSRLAKAPGTIRKDEATVTLDVGSLDDSYGLINVAKHLYESAKNNYKDKSQRGVVIDIPKESDGSEITKSKWMTNGEIFQFMAKKRRVQDAKKRLIWLPKGDKVTALICHLASPEPERDNMAAFLDRHASYDKFFFDGVAPFQNEWETELHLSYFSLLDHDPGVLVKGGTIPYLSYIMVGEPQHGVKVDPESTTQKTLARSSMSFRFVGDFFDRYWTCHILKFDPNCQNKLENLESLVSRPGARTVKHPQDGYREKHPWQQRKVLELLLLDEMLKRIKLNTERILDWVRREVSDAPKRNEHFLPTYWPRARERLERDILSKKLEGWSHESKLKELKEDRAKLSGVPFQLLSTYPLSSLAEALRGDIQSKEVKDSEAYFSQVKLWRFFETILQTIEDDLEENLEKIEEWDRREEERGFQKPRWTRNDERRYGSIINTLRFQTRRETHELQRLKMSIKVFREPWSSKLSSLRDDINFLGSENIKLFTYVTVVFLPLGFATGIFSMNGAPGTATLIGMVITAIVALYLTIGALVNAKTLRDIIVHPIIEISHICGKAVFYYPIFLYLRYIYYPASGTWTGFRILRWLITFQEKGKKADAFKAAKESYGDWYYMKRKKATDPEK